MDEHEEHPTAAQMADDSDWHEFAVIRDVPVYVCAAGWMHDPSVGIFGGFEEIFAVRCDDGTQFDLTDAEIDEWSGKAAAEYEPFGDDMF